MKLLTAFFVSLLILLLIQPLMAWDAELLENLTIEHDGRTRYYDLLVPGRIGDQPAALVLDMHGRTKDKEFQRDLTGFDVVAEREGFIMAYPDGLHNMWDARLGTGADVGFLRALVAQVSSDYNIDPHRIYATGHSMGGGMAVRLACEAADLFTAISTVAATMLFQDISKCNPDRPVPVLSILGLDDNIQPYEGGAINLGGGDQVVVISAVLMLEFWRGKNSCKGPVERENYGSEAWCDTDRNCQDDVQTALCTVTGRDSSHLIYSNTARLNLAELSWDFFRLFTLAGDSSGFQINAGHAGAWYNPVTSGQGQLIDVVPEDQYMFLAWFTFTDAASNNPDEQHWYTAQGNYSGNTAPLILHETLGGQFDDPQEVSTNPVGTATVSFSDCEQGQMTYSIDTDGRQGTVPLQRLLLGSDNVCEEQSAKAANTTEAVDINAGMDGTWVNSDTLGQGFLIDAHPNPDDSNFIFVAWFTYGDDTASGQRWLTAQGDFAGSSTAEIPIHETTGGSFDAAQLVDVNQVGTMTIDFTDCSNAQLSYTLTDDDLAGDMAISRLIPGGQALCEELAGTE